MLCIVIIMKANRKVKISVYSQRNMAPDKDCESSVKGELVHFHIRRDNEMQALYRSTALQLPKKTKVQNGQQKIH